MIVKRKCARCAKNTYTLVPSTFDSRHLCKKCKQFEESHNDYEIAREAQLQAIKIGDYDFKGIGKPEDL